MATHSSIPAWRIPREDRFISKQSGVSEVVEHALKVDFWDINGLADAIYGLCKYKAVNDIFRKEGKEEVDNLKWEYAAKKIKNVYELAINLR